MNSCPPPKQQKETCHPPKQQKHKHAPRPKHDPAQTAKKQHATRPNRKRKKRNATRPNSKSKHDHPQKQQKKTRLEGAGGGVFFLLFGQGRVSFCCLGVGRIRAQRAKKEHAPAQTAKTIKPEKSKQQKRPDNKKIHTLTIGPAEAESCHHCHPPGLLGEGLGLSLTVRGCALVGFRGFGFGVDKTL